jgi:hypothetical protein
MQAYPDRARHVGHRLGVVAYLLIGMPIFAVKMTGHATYLAWQTWISIMRPLGKTIWQTYRDALK